MYRAPWIRLAPQRKTTCPICSRLALSSVSGKYRCMHVDTGALLTLLTHDLSASLAMNACPL